MLSALLGLCEAESERTQGLVVASDLPEALGEHPEEPGRSHPGPDLSQLDHRLRHLREARLAGRRQPEKVREQGQGLR
jgi:hypothetical protein